MEKPIVALLCMAACSQISPTRGMPASGSRIDPQIECQSLEQILSPAMPEPNAARFLKRIHACPEDAGNAIGNALDTLRSSSDTAALRRVADLTQYVHDANIYSVAMDIATDPLASNEARVYAIRTLIWSMAPAHPLSYGSMLMSPPEAKCGVGSRGICSSSGTGHFYGGYTRNSLRWPAVGAPLPADFVAQISNLCSQVGQTPEAPTPVRKAAQHTCWWRPDPQLLNLIRGGG